MPLMRDGAEDKQLSVGGALMVVLLTSVGLWGLIWLVAYLIHGMIHG